MVDAIVTVFLERLLNTLAEEASIVNQFRDQFEKLQNELQLMQCFLKDADKQKRKKETLRKIMANLRELIYEAEDIVADCDLHSREDSKPFNGWLTCISSPKINFFQYQTGKRLKEIHEKIATIKQNILPFLSPSITNDIGRIDANDQMPRWSSPVYDHSQVVGLEDDKRKIKDWLFKTDLDLIEIGIVGMGGLGKTTIAQMVFNDREIEDRFERRMWVSISQALDEERIMRSMLRSLGDASAGDDRGELLRKINQYLLGKRYLLVLDDVWSEDSQWWQRIYHGLPKGNGSSVIITTRHKQVGTNMGVQEERIHWPKFLSKDDSWLLFRKIAFAATSGECVNPDIGKVGEAIVEKCKGLPLAIKAIGGLLLYKSHYQDWRRIAKNFRDELAETDNSVMASLQLSYDELPPYLKSCFLSFVIYPEDCVITKDQLVRWWMGEGFVPFRIDRSSTEAGESCFSGLTNRCLVEVVDKGYNGTIYTCKIHDMVRDLIINTVSADGSQIGGIHCRHLGIQSNMYPKQFVGNRKLRALLSTTKTGEVNKIASSTGNKFSECRYLRVLDVCKSIFEVPLSSLLSQIGSLQHLTYLSLSNTHPLVQLPNSLGTLRNLLILDVSHCQNLKTLPPFLLSFKKLKVLDVRHCGSLECLPKGLGRLSNLEVLLGFKPATLNQTGGCRISELKNLTRLRTLDLHLTQDDEIGDNEVNALVSLRELQFLTISCFDCHDNCLVTKLDKLYPPPELHELSLNFYPGEVSPIWLNPISLRTLTYLSICSGNVAKMHEGFWGDSNSKWNIEGLMFECLLDLELDWGTMQQAMPSLRTVSASWCPNLVSVPIDNVGFRGGSWRKESRIADHVFGF